MKRNVLLCTLSVQTYNHLQTIKQAEKYYVFILKEGPEYVVLCQLATTNHWEQLTTAKQGKIKNPLITP